jgi:hypothetical protein
VITLGCLAASVGSAREVSGQRVQPEVRVDVQGSSRYTVAPGVGANLALGYYARVSAIVGYAPAEDTRFADDHWRGDLLARFVLDPFRQQRWGLSVGGGLSIRRQTYLAAILELEGREAKGFIPALQVGMSGGFRAGLILRRAIRGRR